MRTIYPIRTITARVDSPVNLSDYQREIVTRAYLLPLECTDLPDDLKIEIDPNSVFDSIEIVIKVGDPSLCYGFTMVIEPMEVDPLIVWDLTAYDVLPATIGADLTRLNAVMRYLLEGVKAPHMAGDTLTRVEVTHA